MAEKLQFSKLSKKTADDYANESLAAVMDTTIVYDRKEDLDKWLDKYAPSKTSRLDRIGWIVMECEEGTDDEDDMDFENMHLEWEELKMSDKPVNFLTIRDLAKRNGIVSGGWLFHVETGDKVDILWRKVAKQFAYGVLSDIATRVRVSPVNPDDESRTHVIVVKHRDFTNEEEVYKLNDALRSVGVKGKMLYKPDVYSHLGIYRNNEYHIKPTIYTSQYDILKKVSTVTCNHEGHSVVEVEKET